MEPLVDLVVGPNLVNLAGELAFHFLVRSLRDKLILVPEPLNNLIFVTSHRDLLAVAPGPA